MTVELHTLAKQALIGELEELRGAVVSLAEPLSDAEFWTKPLEPGNSCGHLVLHLTGNLNHFVGAQLGKTGYLREREREFTETQVPSKSQALQGLNEVVGMFRRVVTALSAEQFAATHPEARFGTLLNALLHIVSHFALHRGQMSYIARLVKKGT